jgi:hypothetical protein
MSLCQKLVAPKSHRLQTPPGLARASDIQGYH